MAEASSTESIQSIAQARVIDHSTVPLSIQVRSRNRSREAEKQKARKVRERKQRSNSELHLELQLFAKRNASSEPDARQTSIDALSAEYQWRQQSRKAQETIIKGTLQRSKGFFSSTSSFTSWTSLSLLRSLPLDCNRNWSKLWCLSSSSTISTVSVIRRGKALNGCESFPLSRRAR